MMKNTLKHQLPELTYQIPSWTDFSSSMLLRKGSYQDFKSLLKYQLIIKSLCTFYYYVKIPNCHFKMSLHSVYYTKTRKYAFYWDFQQNFEWVKKGRKHIIPLTESSLYWTVINKAQMLIQSSIQILSE